MKRKGKGMKKKWKRKRKGRGKEEKRKGVTAKEGKTERKKERIYLWSGLGPLVEQMGIAKVSLGVSLI